MVEPMTKLRNVPCISSSIQLLIAKTNMIKQVPWDKLVFGFDCFEIASHDPNLLEQVLTTPGHYTVKVDPLADKSSLHQYGFYYCDTLIEPWCTADRLIDFTHESVSFSATVSIEEIIGISHNAFIHGRFHRDFNIHSKKADARYENWVRELYCSHKVFGLLFEGKVAGFIAYSSDKLVLHAIGSSYRGKGLAKFFWSKVCRHLFEQGHTEIQSSISVANMAVMNLYATLGFRFRSPIDVYHRMVL